MIRSSPDESLPKLAGLAGGPSNIYIASGLCIGSIDRASGQQTALAGCQQEGYENGNSSDTKFIDPSGVATDPDRGVLYVADSGNDAVRTVHLSSGKTETLSGSFLWLPPPMKVGPDGTFEHDGGLNTKLVDGSIGVARFNRPSGLAFDRADSVLYVADSLNGLVRAIDLEGRLVSTLAGGAGGGTGGGSIADGVGSSASFHFPTGLALDDAPHQNGVGSSPTKWLYVADTLAHQVRKVAIVTAYTFEQSVEVGGGSSSYDDGALSGNASSGVNLTEWQLSLEHALEAQWEATHATHANGLEGVDTDAQHGAGWQRHLSLSAVVSTIAGTGAAGYVDGVGTAAAFDQPTGLALSSDRSRLYIADLANRRVRTLDLASGVVSTLAGSGASLAHASHPPLEFTALACFPHRLLLPSR